MHTQSSQGELQSGCTSSTAEITSREWARSATLTHGPHCQPGSGSGLEHPPLTKDTARKCSPCPDHLSESLGSCSLAPGRGLSAPMDVGVDSQPCMQAPGWALGTLLGPHACFWRNTRSWLDFICHGHDGICCYLLKPDLMQAWSCIVCSPNSLENFLSPHGFQPKRQKKHHEKSAVLV